MLLPLLIYAVYAISFTMSKAIFSYLPPLLYVGLRMLCAAGVLLSYTAYTYGGAYILHGIQNNLWPFTKLMIIHTYIPFTLSFIALKEITTVEASLIYNISPCVTAIFSYIIFNKRLSWVKISGLIVSMCALIPLFYSRIITHAGQTMKSVDSLLLLLIAVTSTTYGWLLYSTLNNTYGYNSTLISSYSLFGGGICMVATSYVLEPWNMNVVDALPQVALLFIALLIAVDIIFMNMYGYLLNYYTATFMALIGITLPLFTSLFSWLFLQEQIPRGFVPACILMAIGLYLFYYGENHDIPEAQMPNN